MQYTLEQAEQNISDLRTKLAHAEQRVAARDEVLAALLRQASHNGSERWKDYACAQCVGEDTGHDFICGRHRAIVLTTPPPAQEEEK